VRLATFISPGKDIASAVERVRKAEDLGYEVVFNTQTTGRDGLMVLAAYGAATSRIKLGTGVLPAFPRHPVALAIEAATLDEMIGGRLVLGVGPSHQLTMENWYGIPMDKPLSRLREYVDVLRQIFTGDRAELQGEYYQTMFGFIGYSARRDIPIMVSALAPNMLRFAGEKTEGTILWSCLPSYIRETVAPTINAAASQAGRTVDIIAAVPAALTTNVEAARDAFRKDFFVYMTLPFYRRAIESAGYGDDLKAFDEAMGSGDMAGARAAISDRLLDEFAAIGDAGAIKAKLDEYRDAGTTMPGIGLFAAGDGYAGPEATLAAAIG